MRRALISGIGSALPRAMEQSAVWNEHFRTRLAGSRTAERIFAGAGVRRRHAVADPRVEDVAHWSTGARMRRYAEAAPPLAHQAVRAALDDAAVDSADIGLLVVASCTGYATPGVDIALAESLPLAPGARRLMVGHMGCYAALPALETVADYVSCHGEPAVLVCVELTSLHAQPPTDDTEQIVCHALFGDAASAVVVTPDHGPGLRISGSASRTYPDTSDHMTWQVTDLGFRMGLSRKVPAILGAETELVVKNLLAPHGLTAADVDHWAVHPGGPRVLDTVENALALPRLADSRHVLAEFGNCSSATVPLIIGTLDTSPGDTVVALAFGPGLTLSAALLVAEP